MKRRGFITGIGAAPALILFSGAASAQATPGGVFAHGVASGDPLHDRVILWTRVSLPRGSGAVEVDWQVSERRDFSRVVASGKAEASPERDFCVKVDAAGLAPGQTYFYRFEALGGQSGIGRTRTLPEGEVSKLAFAVASCSNYPAGYFTAYRDIAEQDDLDAVIHLGDYIYEYAADGYASQRAAELGRVSVPGHELLTLDDYRLRHAQYKADPDSQAMHAAHPMIAVWDDHEVANDAWLFGAENHQPGAEGDWHARRRRAWQAYEEWMPTRTPNLADHGRLFRSFDFGDLASLIMLDTRYFGRDRQIDAMALADDPEALAAVRENERRQLLGAEQAGWFAETLKRSADHQRWQVIGQQVLVSELLLPDLAPVLDIEETRRRLGDERVDAVLELGGSGMPMLWDTWDGYAPARRRFLQQLDTDATSPVVLTGDIHTSIAGDLALADRSNNTAVELVTTSISSPGFDTYLPTREGEQLSQAFREANPALRWFETSKRGWVRVDLTPARMVATWRHVQRVDVPGARVESAMRLTSTHREAEGDARFGLRPA
jgi:alkaline phosphatase D